MRTLSEPQASEKATEARSQSEETAARIEEVLQQFEVLSSKAEQRIVSYVYLFISGAALFFTVLYIVVGILWCYSSSLILTVSSASLLIAIGVSLIFWAFNAWRRQTPHILRDVFVKRRIQMSAGDTAREYLGFLEHYGAVLKSPRRYLLIGGLEIITVSFLLIYSREYIKSYYSTVDLVHSIVSLIWLLLMTLMDLGIAYYLGILLWALLISGWHIRELSRRFEFRIEPVHPDHCGGLRLLGDFCFGVASPLFIGSAFCIGYLGDMYLYYLFVLIAKPDRTVPGTFIVDVGFLIFSLLLFVLVAALGVFLPLWNIHTTMLKERERAEENYAARLAALGEQIQMLLNDHRLKEAKAVKEEKELVEALYVPSPAWPFNVRTKFFSALLQAGSSLLLGYLSALITTLAH